MQFKKIWSTRRLQITAAVSASMSFLMAGLSGAWPSPTLPYLLSEDSHIQLTPDQSSWLVSFMPLGSIIGIVPVGCLAKIFGRKTIILAGALPYFVSWILLAFGTTVWELYVARILSGTGIIISFTITPLYVAEISEDAIRGALGTLTQVSFNIGALIEYSLGSYLSYSSLAIASAVFPVIFLLVMIWMPESPYFLLSEGQVDKAQASLMKLRGADNSSSVQQELKLMQSAVEESLNIQRAPLKDLFMKRGNRRALIIVITLIALQVFIGQLAVVSYTTQIFQSSTANVLDPNTCVIILGGIQALSSMVLSSQVDRTGRKPLLIISGGGTTLFILIVGIYFYIEDNTDMYVSAVGWIPMVCLIIYLSLHSLALGVVPFTVIGEVFPTNVKNLAATIALMFHSVASFSVTKLFQIMADGVGTYFPFIVFSIFGILGTMFVVWYVPETKGKPFVQIYEELEDPEYPKKRTIIKENPS